MISRRKLKKAPMPIGKTRNTSLSLTAHIEFQNKIFQIIQNSFEKLFQPVSMWEKSNLSTKELKFWGNFLVEREIYWDIILGKMPNWPDWECYDTSSGFRMRPKFIENHIKVHYYYVPKELAMKMLVLGELL